MTTTEINNIANNLFVLAIFIMILQPDNKEAKQLAIISGLLMYNIKLQTHYQ